MIEIRRTNRRNRTIATWLLALSLAPAVAIPFVPFGASAEAADEVPAAEDDAAKKAEWQDRYRTIRNNSVRMRDNAIKLRRAYSLSQHSNYPRGGARLRFKKQVEDTERAADDYEAKLAAFQDEARQNQIPPGWIFEVDDEPVDVGTPAAVGDDEETHDAQAPEGRNPAYYGGEEDEEELDEEEEDDRGDAFDDFNDDRDDQHRADEDREDRNRPGDYSRSAASKEDF